ncbi:MAG: hypothetical protein GY868_21270 [Deltaproteobacteria bacterium]|nr:hypothetical protein [Deltaproteobacteria bacterium]
MKKIYALGDTHTVAAFRLAGVEGLVVEPEDGARCLAKLAENPDAGIVIITRALADALDLDIAGCNLERRTPAIIAIPGIDEQGSFGISILDYISEALGIPL